MTKQVRWRAALLIAAASLTVAWSGVRAESTVPIVTGEHWTKSSEQVKKAYLVGIANVLQLETAYYDSNPPSDTQSFIPRFVQGLKGGGYTLDSVREGLDTWYAAHPDKVQRPVLEVIWFEMVVPGLKKQ
jgi:hypothetical protein